MAIISVTVTSSSSTARSRAFTSTSFACSAERLHGVRMSFLLMGCGHADKPRRFKPLSGALTYSHSIVVVVSMP